MPSGSKIPLAVCRAVEEDLWQCLFLDPSQWWDSQLCKNSPKHQFLNQKTLKEYSWIEGCQNILSVEGNMLLAQSRSHSDSVIRTERGARKTSKRLEDKVMQHCERGKLKEAMEIVDLMIQKKKRASEDTYVQLLKECIRLKALPEGKQLHAQISASKLRSSIFLANMLVDMYTKCGSVPNARLVFDEMPNRNVFSWNIMISAYTKHGQGKEALALFEKMQDESANPDPVTFVSVLKACMSVADLQKAKQIHSMIEENGLETNVFVGSILVDLYGKCGDIEDAWGVFKLMPERNVVSWTTMIAGYAEHGFGKEALALFKQMEREHVKPNRVTFLSILKACSSLTDLEEGRKVHAKIKKQGFNADVFVGSTLIDMYAKCGSVHEARRVFDDMHERNVVSWNAMIAGYSQHGHGKEALALLKQMPFQGVKPNEFTFASIIKACASLEALEEGKQVHSRIKEEGFGSDVFIGSILIDMYAKCGAIEDAEQVFNESTEKNVVSWNAMVSGYAQHGYCEEALSLFKRMKQEGVKPTETTFTSVLLACSHAGLLDEGRAIFESMSQDHGIKASVEHFACMVDLLGRWGHLVEAVELINKMEIEPDVAVWMALLSACRIHNNIEFGRHAFEHVVKLEPKMSGAYVLLSNIYAAAGRWDEVAKLRKDMQERGLKKDVGCPWIEVNGSGSTFVTADQTDS